MKITRDNLPGVVLAAAADLNDELTILLNGLNALASLGKSNPIYADVVLMQIAAYRSAWTANRLVAISQQHGARPSSATLERLIAA